MNEANLALRQMVANYRAQIPSNLTSVNIAFDLASAGTAITAIFGLAGQVTISINNQGQGQGSFNVSVQHAQGQVNVHAGPLSLLPAAE